MAILVPLTEEEKQSPLYPFYERDMTPVPPERYEAVERAQVDPSLALHPSDMNRLFDEGYLPCEFGYSRLPDGGLMIANIIQMPGVTVEMIDWWFAWHGLQPMRYKIWDKEDHYHCQTRHVDRAMDSSLSYKERYWDTIHDVEESMVGDGVTRTLPIMFQRPENMGFDREKLADFDGTIIISGGEDRPNIMCHFIRPTADGVELRTRFWMGYNVVDGKVRSLGENAPKVPMSFCIPFLKHNIKEYTHLTTILPELFALYRDQFAPF